MGSHTSFALSILLSMSVAQIVLGEHWEFGVSDTPSSVVISHNEGEIGLFERTKKINLAVPQCYVITYVKVQVDNLISSPNVDFNTHTKVVTIAYRLWQHSPSTYDVVAKAVWKQGCIVSPLQLVLAEVWEFGENDPSSRVVSHNQGDISLFDKTRTILLTAPECHEIDYVRVEVNNLLSNPAVNYDKLTQVVTISYKPLQISMSTYDVVAKAKLKEACAGASVTTTKSDTLQLVYGK